MSNEKLYDTEIAPVLRKLGKRCQKLGFSLVAECEWEPGESGTTSVVADGASFAQILVTWAAKAHGNVDVLMMAVMRHAREHGHSSIILKQLGIPANREDAP